MSRGKNLVRELAETIPHLSKFLNQQEMLQADPKAADQTGQRRRPTGLLYEQALFWSGCAPSQYARPVQRTEPHEGGG